VRQRPRQDRFIDRFVGGKGGIGGVYRLHESTEGRHRGVTKPIALGTFDLRRRRPEHQVIVRLMSRSKADVLLDHFLKLAAGRPGSAEDLQLGPRQGIETVAGDRGEQCIFVAEVVVRRGGGDTGSPRHRSQADFLGIGLGDELERRGDQRLTQIPVMLAHCPSHHQRLTVFNTSVKINTVQLPMERYLVRHHAKARFTVGGHDVVVHAMLCGTVTVKRSHAVCCVPERTPAPLRLLAILADRKFAEPMPIWSYAIEHPEGLFVVDAGAAPSYNDPASWQADPRTGGHDPILHQTRRTRRGSSA